MILGMGAYEVNDATGELYEVPEPKPSGGTSGAVQFGWDFSTIFGPPGSGAVATNSPSGTRPPTPARPPQDNTVIYIGLAALAALFFFSQR